MPMFYFHVRHGHTRYVDPQGIEMQDLPAAWQHAHRDARAIAVAGVLDGAIDEQWMEIGDDTGAIVATVPFRRALTTH